MNIKDYFEKLRFWCLYNKLSKMLVKSIEASESSSEVEEELKMAKHLIEKGDYELECYIGLKYLQPKKG